MNDEPNDEDRPTGKPFQASGEKPSPPWAIWNSDWAENLTRILQRLVFVAAALFAVYEFAQGRQDAAEQKAFDLVAIWETDEYQDAFATVRAALAAAVIKSGDIEQSQLSAQELANLRTRIGNLSLEGAEGENVRRSVDTLFYFAGRVGFCSSRGLCDRATLSEFFGDALLSLRSYYAEYILQKRREGSVAFGEYLDQFLGHTGHLR